MKKQISKIALLGTLIATTLFKAKPLLATIKLGKFSGMLFTMVLSALSIALIYPFSFAAIFVLLLLMHEMGHIWAAKLRKIKVSLPTFVLFLGAFVKFESENLTIEERAFCSLGGPIVGTLAAFTTYQLGIHLAEEVLIDTSKLMIVINLLNMLPIKPLDGYWIFRAFTKFKFINQLIKYIILPLLTTLSLIFFYYSEWLCGITLLLTVWSVWIDWKYSYGKIQIKRSLIFDTLKLNSAEKIINKIRKDSNIEFTNSLSNNKYYSIDIFYPEIGYLGYLEGIDRRADKIELVKITELEEPGFFELSFICYYNEIGNLDELDKTSKGDEIIYLPISMFNKKNLPLPQNEDLHKFKIKYNKRKDKYQLFYPGLGKLISLKSKNINIDTLIPKNYESVFFPIIRFQWDLNKRINFVTRAENLLPKTKALYAFCYFSTIILQLILIININL